MFLRYFMCFSSLKNSQLLSLKPVSNWAASVCTWNGKMRVINKQYGGETTLWNLSSHGGLWFLQVSKTQDSRFQA